MDRDREIFEKLWREPEKKNLLQWFFYRHGIPEQDIPDLTNETAYQAYRSFHKLREPTMFEPWVLGIARNMVKRYWRGRPEPRQSADDAADAALYVYNPRIDESVVFKTTFEFFAA